MPLRKTITWKLMFPLGIITLITLLTACGGGGTNTTTTPTSNKLPEDKQIFVWPYEGVQDIATLDPAHQSDVYSAQSIELLFNGLVQVNNKGEIVPDLAASYTISPDGLRWTFKLRDDAKFSDGNPVTSEDVVYSLDRALQPATKSNFAANFLGPIKDAKKLSAGKIKTLIGTSLLAPDPKTVTIVTEKKIAYFLDALTATSVAYIVEKSFVQKYGQDFINHLGEGGGAGLWKISKYQHNKELDFVPNTYYYGQKPQLKLLVRPFTNSIDTSYKDYQVNNSDMASVPTPNLAQAKALPDGQFHQDPALRINFIALNYMVKPFDNTKIRQAFALALNKDEIAQKVFKGTLVPTNHIIPEGAAGYNPNLVGPAGAKTTSGDPALAKKLFEEGLQEEGLTRATMPQIVFSVSSNGSQDMRNAFAVMQQMWQAALNIQVKINDMEFNQLVTSITGSAGNTNVMATIIGWSGTADPQNWTSNQFSPGSGTNFSNYDQNKTPLMEQQNKVIELLAKADANTENHDERMQQYQQAEQQLVDQVSWIPYTQKTTVYVLKPCVEDWHGGAFSPTAGDWANIHISNKAPCANTSSYQ